MEMRWVIGNSFFILISFCDGQYSIIFLQRFIQYLASSNSSFNLSNFLDKSGVQGKTGNINEFEHG